MSKCQYIKKKSILFHTILLVCEFAKLKRVLSINWVLRYFLLCFTGWRAWGRVRQAPACDIQTPDKGSTCKGETNGGGGPVRCLHTGGNNSPTDGLLWTLVILQILVIKCSTLVWMLRICTAASLMSRLKNVLLQVWSYVLSFDNFHTYPLLCVSSYYGKSAAAFYLLWASYPNKVCYEVDEQLTNK